MSGSIPHRRLSVLTIVRDAAEPLRLTLASMREFADELVVIDTGSTDRSRDVAREFGARVSEFTWTDDFSAARNFAQLHATGDWLLWLDAGETINHQDASSLKEFVSAQADPNQAYYLVVRLPPSDGSSSAEQIARVRLLPQRPEIQFSGRVYESPLPSLSRLKIPATGLQYVIRRGDRELDLRLKKQRAHRNLRIAELEIRESSDNARLWNCMGDALQTLGDNSRALECFRRGLSLAKPASPELLEAYYGLLTSLGRTDNEKEEQFSLCIRGLETYPTDAQLLCALGGYLQARGNLPLAGQAYLTAFKYGQVTPIVWHVAEIRDIAAVCHSLTLQLRQETDAAVQFLESALADHPESLRIRRRLIEIFIQQANRDAALAHVSELPKTFPHVEAFRSAVRGACFAVQQNLIAAKAYLNAGYSHGCRDPICLKWLSLCLLSAGDANAARPVLDEWKRIEPRNAEADRLMASFDSPTQAPLSANRRVDAPTAGVGSPTPAVKLNVPSWSPSASQR